ncbi:hypothetical protein FQR65_LT06646 [Abscondita terminalis]|nr:hypothetical protein FQR65_LT06646 [Abscondita terminalis]
MIIVITRSSPSYPSHKEDVGLKRPVPGPDLEIDTEPNQKDIELTDEYKNKVGDDEYHNEDSDDEYNIPLSVLV